MRRRDTFDFAHTCPRIDKEIDVAQATMKDFLSDVLDEACPLLPLDLRREIAEARAKTLYDLLEGCFEAVRATNEEMRREAERQIESLADRVAELEQEVRSAA